MGHFGVIVVWLLDHSGVSSLDALNISPTLPPTFLDDAMKLPRKDMHIFGLCPELDDFVLVVCDYCGTSVKMEARWRHRVRS